MSDQAPPPVSPSSSVILTDHAARFSQRLRDAAARNGVPVTATAFTHWFNRHSRMGPVTVHAVRKWLQSEAIPHQPRLLRLSDLLGVDPSWLRFGMSARSPLDPASDDALPYALLQTVRELPLRDQQLLLALARSMLNHSLSLAQPPAPR